MNRPYKTDAAKNFEFGVVGYRKITTAWDDQPVYASRWIDDDTGSWCWVAHDLDGDWHYGIPPDELDDHKLPTTID